MSQNLSIFFVAVSLFDVLKHQSVYVESRQGDKPDLVLSFY